MVYILAFFSKLSIMKSELPDLYSIHWLSILTTNLKARAQSVAYLAKNPFRRAQRATREHEPGGKLNICRKYRLAAKIGREKGSKVTRASPVGGDDLGTI